MSDDATSDKVKVQANIEGYEAWAFLRLKEKTGWKAHDVCRHIIREWLRTKRNEIAEQYGVSREEWERERGDNVRPITKGRKRTTV